MTVEERVLRYLELASMPENLPYDTSDLMQELDITDADLDRYREKLEAALSLKPVEKRDIVVKQVIKPLLKKFGFTTAGADWRRETEDAYIIIHMQNSQWNSVAVGARFCFHISASSKERIKGSLSDQWMYNQAEELKQFDFLPYCGMLSAFYSDDMYQIDGYKDYLPTDIPVEAVCTQIDEDFGKYILPELSTVQTYDDFVKLRTQKLKRYEEKEIRLLKYYHAAQKSAIEYGGVGYNLLVMLRKNLELNADDIASHLQWLDVCRKNSRFTKVDARELAIRAAKEEPV